MSIADIAHIKRLLSQRWLRFSNFLHWIDSMWEIVISYCCTYLLRWVRRRKPSNCHHSYISRYMQLHSSSSVAGSMSGSDNLSSCDPLAHLLSFCMNTLHRLLAWRSHVFCSFIWPWMLIRHLGDSPFM